LTWLPALLSPATADCAANRLDPSTRASTGVFPVTKATSTLLSRSSVCASAWVSAGSVIVTSKNDGSTAAVCAACGPTTAVERLET
jgi:hypothetical protein